MRSDIRPYDRGNTVLISEFIAFKIQPQQEKILNSAKIHKNRVPSRLESFVWLTG